MGYTHYWYRPKVIGRETFSRMVEDFRKLVPALAEAGAPIAGPYGEGEPEITPEVVHFNGVKNCGHPEDPAVVIPWPAAGAGGVGSSAGAKAGVWFGGVLLNRRTCNGDCSYESFYFPRVRKPYDWEKPYPEGWFDFCKTAFRPYDLAVTAFLIVARHHLGPKIVVRSDGDDEQWADAKMLCQVVLGYGLQYRLTRALGLVEEVKTA